MHPPTSPCSFSCTWTLCPHSCIRGCMQYIPYLRACHRCQSPSLPFPPLVRMHVITLYFISLHFHSFLFFIALVVIKCAMCTSIQVVCTPKNPLCALQSPTKLHMLVLFLLALHTAVALFAAPLPLLNTTLLNRSQFDNMRLPRFPENSVLQTHCSNSPPFPPPLL